MENKRFNTRTLTGMALLTAIVVILQFLGAFIRFGTFSISLVLIPIVVGAALYGALAGPGWASCSAWWCCSAATRRPFWW